MSGTRGVEIAPGKQKSAQIWMKSEIKIGQGGDLVSRAYHLNSVIGAAHRSADYVRITRTRMRTAGGSPRASERYDGTLEIFRAIFTRTF
jgi:hypothetical protein